MDTTEVSENSSLKLPLDQIANQLHSPKHNLEKSSNITTPNQQSSHINPSGSDHIPTSSISGSASVLSEVEDVLETANSNVTFNVLNTSENEVDGEGFGQETNNRINFTDNS